MTVRFQRHLSSPGLLADDDVLIELHRWQTAGERTALVTLIGVEGGAPRQPGAQMAVSQSGSFAGYLSGGCLESAVAMEAQDVISQGRNRLVRYGKGSPYFDVKLPCGSGLDLYFDQSITAESVAEILKYRAQRICCQMITELDSGTTTVEPCPADLPIPDSARTGAIFTRICPPPLSVTLIGNGPSLVSLAVLSAATGIELTVITSDDATRAELETHGLSSAASGDFDADALTHLDRATAAVLCFHAHEQEPVILGHLLHSQCFYIGALGNHAVHRERLAQLSAQGFDAAALSRIRAPVGLISGAKSKATLAIGTLAELMTEAKACNLIA